MEKVDHVIMCEERKGESHRPETPTYAFPLALAPRLITKELKSVGSESCTYKKRIPGDLYRPSRLHIHKHEARELWGTVQAITEPNMPLQAYTAASEPIQYLEILGLDHCCHSIVVELLVDILEARCVSDMSGRWGGRIPKRIPISAYDPTVQTSAPQYATHDTQKIAHRTIYRTMCAREVWSCAQQGDHAIEGHQGDITRAAATVRMPRLSFTACNAWRKNRPVLAYNADFARDEHDWECWPSYRKIQGRAFCRQDGAPSERCAGREKTLGCPVGDLEGRSSSSFGSDSGMRAPVSVSPTGALAVGGLCGQASCARELFL